MAAGAVVLLIIVLSVGAPLLAEYVFRTTFDKQDLLHTYGAPTLDPPAYLLGTDEVGRSQVVRLFYGGQVSLFVAFVAAFIPLTLRVLLGLLAGYFRGPPDHLA